MHTYTYVYIHVYIHIYIYTYTYTSRYIFVYIHIYIYEQSQIFLLDSNRIQLNLTRIAFRYWGSNTNPDGVLDISAWNNEQVHLCVSVIHVYVCVYLQYVCMCVCVSDAYICVPIPEIERDRRGERRGDGGWRARLFSRILVLTLWFALPIHAHTYTHLHSHERTHTHVGVFGTYLQLCAFVSRRERASERGRDV